MRVFSRGGVRIEYPEAYSYVFNPMNIDVYGIGLRDKVIVSVGGVEISATPFNDAAKFDVSQIAQTLFSSRKLSCVDNLKIADSPTSLMVTVSVPFVNFSFTTLCVWGALQTDMGMIIGGDYNDDFNSDFAITPPRGTKQASVWHYGLPFTVSVPMLAGHVMNVAVDGGVERSVMTANYDAIVNVSPELLLLDMSITVIKRLKLYVKSGSTVLREYDMVVDYADCNRIYLRWIDKKGYYCYWAFGKASDAFNSEKKGVFINSFSRSVDYVDGFNGGDGRQQGKVSVRSVSLVAELVDEATWSFLLGITQSPIVDVYTQNDYLGKPRWLKTEVATGNMAKGNAILSDFNITVSLPSINNQQL